MVKKRVTTDKTAKAQIGHYIAFAHVRTVSFAPKVRALLVLKIKVY
jgi:hypothetical protein